MAIAYRNDVGYMAIMYSNDAVLRGNYVQEWRSDTWQLRTVMT